MVDDISTLARLRLPALEQAAMAGSWSGFSPWTSSTTLDTCGRQALSPCSPSGNVMRADQVSPPFGPRGLLGTRPGRDGEAFLVPKAVGEMGLWNYINSPPWSWAKN